MFRTRPGETASRQLLRADANVSAALTCPTRVRFPPACGAALAPGNHAASATAGSIHSMVTTASSGVVLVLSLLAQQPTPPPIDQAAPGERFEIPANIQRCWRPEGFVDDAAGAIADAARAVRPDRGGATNADPHRRDRASARRADEGARDRPPVRQRVADGRHRAAGGFHGRLRGVAGPRARACHRAHGQRGPGRDGAAGIRRRDAKPARVSSKPNVPRLPAGPPPRRRWTETDPAAAAIGRGVAKAARLAWRGLQRLH